MPSIAKPYRPLPINSLYGKHAGETIFVIGTSYSLNDTNLELTEGYTKIGINRAIRRISSEYLSMSESCVFDACRDVIEEERPILLLYAPCARQLGTKLANIPYTMTKLEDRDGHKIGPRGQKEDFIWNKLTPEHPYYKFYPDKRQIAQPGAIQADGLFLRSNSNCIYALEWAFRMLKNDQKKPGLVILLGIDLRRKEPRNKRSLTYIPEINTLSVHDRGVRLPSPERIAPHLGRAHEVMAEENIRLVNGSPESGPLDEFLPRERLEELLK